MDIKTILDESRIKFGIKADNKKEIIKELAEYFLEDKVVDEDKFEVLLNDLYERENLSSTGMQEGIAIPHTKSLAVNKISMIVAIDKNGKDFSSLDEEPSKVFFMVVAPEDTRKEHLDILSNIAKLTFEEEKLEQLINSSNASEVIEILESL